jgi:excisionase family DNA binding protein
MNFADRFYSVGELADLTGYHPDSIYRAIARGALAAAKPGGKWLIDGAAIDTWLRSSVTKVVASRPASCPRAHRPLPRPLDADPLTRDHRFGSWPADREQHERRKD